MAYRIILDNIGHDIIVEADEFVVHNNMVVYFEKKGTRVSVFTLGNIMGFEQIDSNGSEVE